MPNRIWDGLGRLLMGVFFCLPFAVQACLLVLVAAMFLLLLRDEFGLPFNRRADPPPLAPLVDAIKANAGAMERLGDDLEESARHTPMASVSEHALSTNEVERIQDATRSVNDNITKLQHSLDEVLAKMDDAGSSTAERLPPSPTTSSPPRQVQPRRVLVLVLNSPQSPAMRLREAFEAVFVRGGLSNRGSKHQLALVVVTTSKVTPIFGYDSEVGLSGFDFGPPPDGASEELEPLGRQLEDLLRGDGPVDRRCVVIASTTCFPPRTDAASWPDDVQVDALLIQPHESQWNGTNITRWQQFCLSRRGALVVLDAPYDNPSFEEFTNLARFHLYRFIQPLYDFIQ